MLLKTITEPRSFFRLALFTGALAAILLILVPQPANARPEEPAQNWIEAVHVSPDSLYGSFAPVIQKAPDGTIMVMYNHERTGALFPPYTPYFSRSEDGGNTWVTGSAYTGSESAAQLDFAFDGASQAHVVWRAESGIYYAGENDWPVANGTQIAPSEGNRVDAPAIAVQGDTIFVVWLQANNSNIKNVFYRYSRDGGQSWNPPLPAPALTTVGDNDASAAPDVAFDANGDVHVVWEESTSVYPTGFSYEIYHVKGTRTDPGGIYQWQSPTNLSDGHPEDAGASYQPSITNDGNALHVIFEEREAVAGGSDEANAQISPYHVAFIPGSGWQAPQRILGDTAFYVNTRLPFYLGTTLAACDGEVHVFFHGAQKVNTTEVIWGTSNRDGNWSHPEPVTSPTTRHTNPSVACSGTVLYLTFEQIVSPVYNHQIYYTDNTAGGVLLPIIFR